MTPNQQLRYRFHRSISPRSQEKIAAIVDEFWTDGALFLDGCACPAIDVNVPVLPPLNEHFNATFACDCPKNRPPIDRQPVDILHD
jgi:hypothetical protein